MAMDKYAVADVEGLQRAELDRVNRQIADLSNTEANLYSITKEAAAELKPELHRLKARAVELEQALRK